MDACGLTGSDPEQRCAHPWEHHCLSGFGLLKFTTDKRSPDNGGNKQPRPMLLSSTRGSEREQGGKKKISWRTQCMRLDSLLTFHSVVNYLCRVCVCVCARAQIHVDIPESVHACPRFCSKKPVLSTDRSDFVWAVIDVKLLLLCEF